MSKFFQYDIHGYALFLNEKVMVLDGTCRIAEIIKENKKTLKIRFEDGTEKNYNSNKLKLQNKKRIEENDDLTSFNDFLKHIETSISEYDNELKHTVNGKKEYVFNDNEFVGESTLKFIPKAQDVINKNKYTYDLFIKTLDIKFPNILIIESTPYILHYKLKGKLNV